MWMLRVRGWPEIDAPIDRHDVGGGSTAEAILFGSLWTSLRFMQSTRTLYVHDVLGELPVDAQHLLKASLSRQEA